jgi:hypothetical protein
MGMVTHRNVGRHGRAALTDTHFEVWEETITPVTTPCLLVETLELGHRDVAGDGDLGAIVVLLRRVYVSDMRVIGELSENQRVTRGPLYLVTGRSRTILDGPRPWHAKD